MEKKWGAIGAVCIIVIDAVSGAKPKRLARRSSRHNRKSFCASKGDQYCGRIVLRAASFQLLG